MNPTVPFKIRPEGYEVTGDMETGYTAVVNYFMQWQYAFTFVDQIFARAKASTVGPITYYMPYRFPPAVANLYASAFTLTPCGASGAPITSYGGLAPGEYFTHAMVRVTFKTLPASQNATADDPSGQQQLDPTNPITMCEQSVKMISKMETRKAGSFYYATTGKPVPTDFAVIAPECKLVLTFPNVPYLPWHIVKNYIGTVNDVPILDCARGTLLLEGMDTKCIQTNQGMSQAVQFEFSENPDDDWNKLPDPNGTLVLVYRSGTNNDLNRIYDYKDFGEIFRKITYLPIP